MRLEKVEIIKYKSCEKTLLNINDTLTALIGVNGSGKTSILSAIKLLKRITDNRYHYFSNNSKNLLETIVVAVFTYQNIKVELKSTFDYDIGSHSQEEIASIKTEWRIQNIYPKKWIDIPVEILLSEFRSHRRRTMSDKMYLTYKAYEKFRTLKDNIPKDFFEYAARAIEFIESINYYSATQFSDPQRCPTSIELEAREADSAYRYSKRATGPHSAFIMDLVNLHRESPDKYIRYLNLIGPRGIGLIDDLVFDEINFSSEEINVKSGGKVVTDVRTKFIVVPKILLGKKILSFNQLSEGTFKTAALLFYILHKQDSVLLLEEPEVCVHHGLLRSIISIIKDESDFKQIIISTHSDFVLDQLKPEHLVIVSRSNEKGTTAKTLSKTLTKNNYKALHAYLEEVGNLGDFWKEGGFDE
ncbi:AAA family ATPase [Geomonas paludis]|uniref:ATPase AAA-type core domain-containing protein n=1 Tax=Geomonas paludis TaxID=2740185 RepID=A0A6V8MVA1_9BACT|nr:ATP-binding protein [Geomonas paludis]GFO64115.1 hypothetical protein GMPD_20340 [Geomonas paludis]